MLWRIFKILLTIIVLLFSAAIIWIAKPGDNVGMVIATFLLLGAIAMWLDYRKSPALAFGGVILTLLSACFAYRIATGGTAFPQHCSGHGSLLCELENLLYVLGGPVAAAIPWALVSGGFLYASCRTFRRWRNSKRSDMAKIPKG
jgi:hypothetical protein